MAQYLRFLPAWLAGFAVVVAALTPPTDTDFWWHLKTGQYLVEEKALPYPDPFSYTATSAREGYSGEQQTRHFNLTHEWLAQVLLYGLYSVGGFPLLVIFRALLIGGTAALAGWLAYSRGGGVWWSAAGTLLAGACLMPFTADRPALWSFFLTALAIAILESRKRLWVLPVIAVLWANLHGGFFLLWVVCGVYALTAWLNRAKAPWSPVAVPCLVAGVAALANPNFASVATTLLNYRQSPLTATLVEWQSPAAWGPPYAFQTCFGLAVLALILAGRQRRTQDILLLLAFSVAGWMAFRNTPLVAIVAPMLLASYLPLPARWPAWVPAGAGALLMVVATATGETPRRIGLTPKLDLVPEGAAKFLETHAMPGPIFNMYEDGGYLIWRLAPAYKTFIDGRALSETVFHDYRIIAGAVGRGSTEQRAAMLSRYGVRTMVIRALQPNHEFYPLILPLANPEQEEWKLVFEDSQSMIFTREVPDGMAVLPASRIPLHLERECRARIQATDDGSCAGSIGLFFAHTRDVERATSWLGQYISGGGKDPKVREAFFKIRSGQ